jgi:hypothetical protein
MRKWYVVGALAVAAFLLPATAAGAGQGPSTLPPDARQAGWGYEELSEAWWQWAVSFPADTSPVADPTGALCQLGNRPVVFGETVPVFFLAGTTGGPTTRQCQIPLGAKIFIPAVNIEDSLVEADSGGTIEGAREVVTSVVDTAFGLNATLDGRPVGTVRAQALDGFPIDWAPNNPFGVTPGLTVAVADGYYTWLPPLTPGEHTLTVGGSVLFGGTPFTVSVTYNLTVG